MPKVLKVPKVLKIKVLSDASSLITLVHFSSLITLAHFMKLIFQVRAFEQVIDQTIHQDHQCQKTDADGGCLADRGSGAASITHPERQFIEINRGGICRSLLYHRGKGFWKRK